MVGLFQWEEVHPQGGRTLALEFELKKQDLRCGLAVVESLAVEEASRNWDLRLFSACFDAYLDFSQTCG